MVIPILNFDNFGSLSIGFDGANYRLLVDLEQIYDFDVFTRVFKVDEVSDLISAYSNAFWRNLGIVPYYHCLGHGLNESFGIIGYSLLVLEILRDLEEVLSLIFNDELLHGWVAQSDEQSLIRLSTGENANSYYLFALIVWLRNVPILGSC